MVKGGAPELASSDIAISQTYWDIVLRSDGIVWLKRTTIVYPSIEELHRSYGEFLKVVDDWILDRRIKSGELGTRTRTPMAWLTDMRLAPTRRNDPEFERAIQARRPDLLRRSPIIGVLVQSASGKMQLTRMSRMDNAALSVFDDFDEAVTALRARMAEVF